MFCVCIGRISPICTVQTWLRKCECHHALLLLLNQLMENVVLAVLNLHQMPEGIILNTSRVVVPVFGWIYWQ